MFVDIYTHILPPAVAAALEQLGSGLGIAKRMKAVRDVHDMESRFRSMDQIKDYRQIVSLPNPPIEAFTTPKQAIDLARVANDGMAELCRKHPDRFPGFVAALPMHEIEPSIAEAKRALDQLGAKGIQLFTNVNGKPIDAAEYAPLFALAAQYDLPVWLHPTRTADFPDYTTEKFSRYEMWWCFGWPYETSVAMARLVFTGLFDRHPKIKVITHHGGGMIPFYDKRIEHGLASLGGRTKEEDYSGVLKSLQRPFMDYFHDFYADTALFGDSLGLDCALKFFGNDKMVFASDAPFGPIKLHTDAIEARDFERPVYEAITRRNAEKLLKNELCMTAALPPFVLVHGAWQGNWVWERVADRLRAAGHRVYTPSLTGLGERAHLAGPQVNLETHIADVTGVIEHHELDNIVLVGHSYGGMVVGGAADRVPQKIASLVYLDAFIPEAGKSLWDLLPPEGAAAQRASAKDGWRVARISAAEFRVQGSDDIARLDRRAVDQPLATMDQKSSVTGAWKNIPHLAYIRASGQPRATFAQFADQVRADPKWQYFEVPCGHNVMLDLPDALTGILLGCAAKVAK